MKPILISLVLLIFVNSIYAKTPFGLDSISIPTGYTFEHSMGVDSYVGTIQKKDGLKISCDIGVGAGFWARPEDKGEYLWFREIQIDSTTAHIALRGTPERKKIGITYKKYRANFTCEVQSESDVAEFMSILWTYKPSWEMSSLLNTAANKSE